MSNGLSRGFLAALLCSLFVAGCGSDSKSSDDGTTAGTTAAQGQACGAVFCLVRETCEGTGATAVCVPPGTVAGTTAVATTCAADTDCTVVGQKCCSTVCVAVDTNTNCGACGVACPSTQSCTAGACTDLVCSTASTTTEDDGGTATTTTPGCPTNEVCSTGTGTTPSCMCGTGPGCGAGETCSATGTCACGSTGIACTGTQECCDGACIDTQIAATSCGACGHACAPGETCTAGVCGCGTAGETACDGACVNLQTDATNCGKCGEECPTDATCTAGVCTCPVGQIACKGACVDASDDAHCGGCDTKCTGDTAGNCGQRDSSDPANPFECLCDNFNWLNCNGTCVDPRLEATCGACDVACDGADPRVCADPDTGNTDTWERECKCASAGQTYCADSNDCVDLKTDEANCGKCGVECLVGESCTDGVCSCPNGGELFCEEGNTYSCIDATNEANCYGCGVTCSGSSNCSDTEKACVCDDTSKTYCEEIAGANKCTDAQTDELNCGGCGIKCPTTPASTCTAGECSCPTGKDWCDVGNGLECAPVTDDVDNCGSCGNACDLGDNCCGGTCKAPGTATDASNCGPCAVQCKKAACGGIGPLFKTDEKCTAGVCGC